MNGARSMGITALLAAGFGWGVLYLFNLQFAGGDVYPPFSTLRDDPAGAKVIYESLSRLPGINAGRSYVPFERLMENGSTVFLLGLDPPFLAAQTAPDLRRLEQFAGRGNRLVLAVRLDLLNESPRSAALEQLWGVQFALEGERTLYFAEAKNWNVLEQVGQKVLIVERNFGSGSIVFVANGEIFSNKSLAVAPQPALIARIIGSNARLLFDETHLGIIETGSIVGLARRFRLHGLAIGLAIWAALFLWKSASAFPPVPSPLAAESASGRTSVSGLVTLLQRHIPPDELVSVCWQEWLKSNSGEISQARKARAEAVARIAAARPIEALHEIQAILHSKGEI